MHNKNPTLDPTSYVATKTDHELDIIPYNEITPQQEAQWREHYHIGVTNWGNIGPVCKDFAEVTSRFSSRGTSPLVAHIEKQGWKYPSPVQQAALPALYQGRDVLVLSETGSGKTAAYLLPLLCALSEPSDGGTRALVVAPTKELCDQIARVAVALAPRMNILHVQKKKSVEQSLRATSRHDLLVSTPMILLNYLSKGVIKLPDLRFLVLDEADALMESQFVEQTDAILEWLLPGAARSVAKDGSVGSLLRRGIKVGDEDNDQASSPHEASDSTDASSRELSGGSPDNEPRDLPEASAPHTQPDRPHIALFSASINDQILSLVDSFLTDPVVIRIKGAGLPTENVTQHFAFAGQEQHKMYTLQTILQDYGKPPVMIFVQTADRALQLYQNLAYYSDWPAGCLHSGLSNARRLEIVNKFRRGEIWVLICTDLGARGLDFAGVNLIVNYDVPRTVTTYIHRVGRSGRHKHGTAVSIFTESDHRPVRAIAKAVALSGQDVPDWLTTLKGFKVSGRKHMPARPGRHGAPIVDGGKVLHAKRKRVYDVSKMRAKRE